MEEKGILKSIIISWAINFTQECTLGNFSWECTHLNNSVSGSFGALNRMEIPRFIKGLVKSITVSRAWLIVMDATAKSALRSNNCLTIPFQSPLHSELFLRNMIQKKSFLSSKDFSDNFCPFWAPQKLFSSFKNYVKNCWCRKYSRCNDFMGGNQ